MRAVVVLSLVAPLATAVPVASAGAAGVVEPVQEPCGLVAVLDPFGGQPSYYHGAYYGGPWDPGTAGAHDVVLRCTSVKDGWPVGGGESEPAPVGVLASPLALASYDLEGSYLCTEVEWDDATGHHVLAVDVDPATPGRQCTGPYLPS